MFTKARQSLLVDSVVEQIEEAVVRGLLKPGDKLPPTDELQASFGASRGTLREAFRVLRQKGLLRAKAGAGGGIFIRPISSAPVKEGLGLLIRAGRIELKDLTDFREGLEGYAAELAAGKTDRNGYGVLESLLEKLKELSRQGPGRWSEFHAVEASLHQELVRLTENPLFELTVITVHENIGGYYRRYLPKSQDILDRNCRDWSVLIKALQESRTGEAGRIMREHIRWSNREMITSRGEEAAEDRP